MANIEQLLVVRKVKAASVYKLLFGGLLVDFVLLGVVFGISGFLGADTVKLNNQPIHGVAALFIAPVLSAFFALPCAGILGTLINFGLWLFFRFRTLSIRVVLAQSSASMSDTQKE
jgi:hypothetical protein